MEIPRINGNGTNGHAAHSPAPNGVNGAASPPSEQPNKIFVGGISANTNVQMLIDYFSKFGDVVDVTVPIDNMTKRQKGFGFVTFAETESVDKVLEQKRHVLDGKVIDPQKAMPKNDPSLQVKSAKRKAHTLVAEREEHQPNKVFIGGVDGSTSVEDIRTYFEDNKFVVRDVELRWDDETGRHRGFGFVTFANEDFAKAAVQMHRHSIGQKSVECKPARPKKELAAESARKQREQSVEPHSQLNAAAQQFEPHSQLNAAAQQFVPMQQHPGVMQPPTADLNTHFYQNINALTAAQQQLTSAGVANGLLQQQGGLAGQHYQGAGPAWTPAGAVGGAVGGYGVQPTPPPTPEQWLTISGGFPNMLPPQPPAANGHHAMSAAGNGFGVNSQMFHLTATNGNHHTNAVNSQASNGFVGSPMMSIGTWQPQMPNSPPQRAPTMMYAASNPSQAGFNVPGYPGSRPQSPPVNPAMTLIQNIGFSWDAPSKGGKASNGFPPVSKNQ